MSEGFEDETTGLSPANLSPQLSVAAGRVVSLRYIMRNGRGEELENTISAAPIAYLHGSKGIQVLLQKQLEGLTRGARTMVYLGKHGAGDRFEADNRPNNGQPGNRAESGDGLESGSRTESDHHPESGDGPESGDRPESDDRPDDDFSFDVIIDEVREALPEELVLGYPVLAPADACPEDCICYTEKRPS